MTEVLVKAIFSDLVKVVTELLKVKSISRLVDLTLPVRISEIDYQ